MKRKQITATEIEDLIISNLKVKSKLEMKTEIYKVLEQVLNTGRRAEMMEREGFPKKTDEELLSGYTQKLTHIFMISQYGI